MKPVILDRRTLLAGAAAGALAPSGLARAPAAPLVRISDGQLRGFERNGTQLYLGIPYGAPTDGARRFLPPQPPSRWQGVRDATRFGQRAPQRGRPIYESPLIGPYMAGGRQAELIAFNEPMGEDCLVLNVITPRADQAGRPVLVYLHGGGYTSGSGATLTLGDRFAAEHDIVLVTVNHRLGGLGFAYLGGLSPRFAAGNPGMLDLIAALTWVRDNIHAFGGDPTKVTIFGESGGGGKVALLMAMPQAQGLFRAAIVESGVLPAPPSAEAATEAVRKILTDQGRDPSNPSALQALPAEQVLQLGAAPVADGQTLSANPWAHAPATVASVPLLIGYCADEATLFAGMRDQTSFTLDWSQLPTRLADSLKQPAAALEPVIVAYRSAYPAANASDIFFRVLSIGMFGANMIREADLKATQSPPVFFYRMEYDTGLAPGLRAFHTSELPLAMRMVLRKEAEPLSRRIAGAWANFARHGDPNGGPVPAWPRYDPARRNVMIFDREARPIDRDPESTPLNLLLSAVKLDGVLIR